MHQRGATDPQPAVPDREAPAAHPRAVPDPERSLLYDGVSRDGMGRSQYLKERAKRSPTERWRNPVTSAQAVGWDALEYSGGGSRFPRKHIVNEQFLRPRGVFVFDSF
eukprot:GGOE01054715.1.p3 GENE.GGOE01054715.1~~GGOE01054715.1.p3  ORF type:complete len:108 (+),score=9.41 GGOE01054715.1:101-424(+)